jgi:hypothetical protein
MQMTLEQFHKRFGDGKNWTEEEWDSIVEMFSQYAHKGNEQCSQHDHMYDEVIQWCLSNSDALDGDRRRKATFVKRMFDIAIGIGVEVGIKQASGLQILLAASQKGEEDEPKNDENPPTTGG